MCIRDRLYVDRLLKLDESQKRRVNDNISATIKRIKQFQNGTGGFSYWPGGGDMSEWGTNYAGHFLLEAKKRGYSLPPNLIDRWKKAQAKTARSWQITQPGNRYYYRNNHLVQAYRLYTLALANAPEWGAMNRMLEMKEVSKEAKWRLAAAYAIGGKKDVAQKIIDQLDTQLEEYTELSRSYGSSLRDQAMILETLDLLGNKSEAGTIVRTISDQLSKNKWYGTNTVSYC